ncbi:maleylpyruvate isomerase family mycothiol-dependent enzyme [Pseudonocardia sp. TRM90224]|uniref:maleylpyruvate isomerase family mycothiol-dependent enzyme n=1 Tax=Pseudonocardia sp. TRM90224 TaxID=2812678 RepID=UPI001E3B6FCC|nr:maleylpyruvate isomerase family mycothiol-dependent enzyme [Pseudonocardia sp. TRM90224]
MTAADHRRWTSKQVWAAAHAERAALAADLTGLADDRWATPSLCAGLDVRDVLAHLTAAASVGPFRWIVSVVQSRFDFDRHNADRLAEQLGADPAETLARFRRIITSTTAPFGPRIAWLGEVVVHGEDIRRPLGIGHTYDREALTQLAIFYRSTDFTVQGRTLTRGLRVIATDGPFAAGPDDGPRVIGTTLALTMVMAGRPAFCAELAGDGVAILRDRLTAGARP